MNRLNDIKFLEAIIMNKELSNNSKILYIGLMLKEKELNSIKIEMPLDDICLLLGCGKNVALKTIKELETNGFIKSKRRGLGKCNTYEVL